MEEEIEKLKQTKIEDDTVYRASLFAILTGLRFGAIKSLTWGDLNIPKILIAGIFISLIRNPNGQ